MRYLVIHHSANPADSTPLEIARYHVQTLGWPGIGYHWVVSQTGHIYYVGDMETVRYSVAHRNREVVSLCLPGDWSQREPPDAQIASARRLVGYLRTLLPPVQIVGHGEIADLRSPTSCPGATWPVWRARLA